MRQAGQGTGLPLLTQTRKSERLISGRWPKQAFRKTNQAPASAVGGHVAAPRAQLSAKRRESMRPSIHTRFVDLIKLTPLSGRFNVMALKAPVVHLASPNDASTIGSHCESTMCRVVQLWA